MLPDLLQKAILAEADSCGLAELTKAREALTARYKSPRERGPLIRTPAERLSYIMTRMPATYAAVYYCLEQLKKAYPQFNPRTILDAGAGPATASWASSQLFSSLKEFTLIERDLELAALGKKIAASSPLEHGHWILQDLAMVPTIPKQDLVICSYALGEIPANQRAALVDWLWELSNDVLLLIEPGSRQGFDAVRTARDRLIEKGAHIAAPCPHESRCPMPVEDWCHFSVRLERSWMHRYLKSGTLGYEDEKFAYVALMHSPVKPFRGRVVSPPEKHTGHVRLRLCAENGELETKVVSRKVGEEYKKARKLLKMLKPTPRGMA